MSKKNFCDNMLFKCLDDNKLSKTRKKMNKKSHKKRVYGMDWTMGVAPGVGTGIGDGGVGESFSSSASPGAFTTNTLSAVQTGTKHSEKFPFSGWLEDSGDADMFDDEDEKTDEERIADAISGGAEEIEEIAYIAGVTPDDVLDYLESNEDNDIEELDFNDDHNSWNSDVWDDIFNDGEIAGDEDVVDNESSDFEDIDMEDVFYRSLYGSSNRSDDFETDDFETDDFETDDFETDDFETDDFETDDFETDDFDEIDDLIDQVDGTTGNLARWWRDDSNKGSLTNPYEEEQESGPTKIDQARMLFQLMINRPNTSRGEIIAAFEEQVGVTNSTAVSYYERLAKEAGLTNRDSDIQAPMSPDTFGAARQTQQSTAQTSGAHFQSDGEIDGDEEVDGFEIEGDPDRQGVIRVVDNAHLVYKRQTPEGTFEELWAYNIGSKIQDELKIRRDILAGTDIPANKTQSEDGNQTYVIKTLGNAQLLHITGLSN